ncbi:MAG: hypothetical protein ACRD4K_12050 [Candidatus Acidiferrales bacterium]
MFAVKKDWPAACHSICVTSGNTEAAMGNIVNLAGMASAVAGSFAISLLLGWLSLRGILLLMPVGRPNQVHAPAQIQVKAERVPVSRRAMNPQRAA